MEKIFARLSWLSATTLLLVLLATLYVLYIQAKPAMNEFGWQFVLDPRWGVDVIVDETGNEVHGSHDEASDVDSGGVVRLDMGDDEDAIPMEDETATGQPELAEGDLDGEAIDEEIPMEDETATGQDELAGEAKTSNIRVVYGGLVPIVGTVLSTLIAMAFAVPLAMGIAVFLSEISIDGLKTPVGVAIELLAAIPSIIYGMWGLFFFGPLVAHVFGGSSVSLLVAGLVLGVMVIPFMAALSRDAINTTPNVLKESAYAVGATRFEVVKDIIFPYARTGILGSIIISLGRALGETMAVAFVIGGVYKLAEHITDPTISIPVALANNFAESSGLSLASLYYLAFILFVVSFVIIFTAKEFLLRRSKY
ncbi:phosphate ABC transporter permease subunit PstC [Sulfurivirga sp.]|uniref:phosphate ABC transporter permease subunit PstC n=1 Tax=Sulfurivirga sp. TaxID=2614236 RepID=UPI0025DE8F16|nr:phosphate ABC transporter permease subunit PstC [Sulfurivirga sp.]